MIYRAKSAINATGGCGVATTVLIIVTAAAVMNKKNIDIVQRSTMILNV